MSYSSEVLADTPLAYWRLNTLSGTETDQGSGGHTLTFNNEAQMTRQSSGLIGSDSDTAVQMNSQSGAYLSTPNAADLIFTGGAFTAELWFRPTVIDAGQSYALVGQGGFTAGGWMLQNRLGVLALYFDGPGDIISTFVPVVNTTYHIAVAWRASGNTDFYVNNVKENITTAGTPVTTTHQAAVGAFGDTAGFRNGQGGFDEVAIYNTGLSDARVAAHFNAATAAAPTLRIIRSTLRW